MADRTEIAKSSWAKRRFNDGLSMLTAWLGRRPSRMVLWADDYDRIKNPPDDIELVKGPQKPDPKNITPLRK